MLHVAASYAETAGVIHMSRKEQACDPIFGGSHAAERVLPHACEAQLCCWNIVSRRFSSLRAVLIADMENELPVQQKLSRFASPLVGERSPKRSRRSLEPEEAQHMRTAVDIVEDGDALLVVHGLSSSLDAPVGLRVSRFVMSMVSTIG